MNTRVQVEHPVTEVQTGIDIVKEQLWIAFTGDTALNQVILTLEILIECRINAEKPVDCQPSPGTMMYNRLDLDEVDGSMFKVVRSPLL